MIDNESVLKPYQMTAMIFFLKISLIIDLNQPKFVCKHI